MEKWAFLDILSLNLQKKIPQNRTPIFWHLGLKIPKIDFHFFVREIY
jgi:hypothetical protein